MFPWLISIQDTGARPYSCKICKRPFARQDSLARHEKLHTRRDHPEPPQYPSPPSSYISQPRLSSPLSSAEHNEDILTELGAPTQVLPSASSASNSSVIHNAPLSADLDFDLVWPDSEDLFETLMSESSNQWQLPMGTLPISGRASSASFGPTIGNISSGESHLAVHNVSEMVTALVRPLELSRDPPVLSQAHEICSLRM
jgi:hypothetical protein